MLCPVCKKAATYTIRIIDNTFNRPYFICPTCKVSVEPYYRTQPKQMHPSFNQHHTDTGIRNDPPSVCTTYASAWPRQLSDYRRYFLSSCGWA